MPTTAPRLILAVPAAGVFVVVAIAVSVLAPTPLPVLVGLIAGVASALLVAWWIDRGAADSALRLLGARPLEPGQEPRLENLVHSICASHGISEPKLYAVDSRAPDAAVAGRSDDTRLVVTMGALRQLDRLELEAVVARELVQFGSGIHSATVLASVSWMLGPLANPLRARLLDGRRLAVTDLDGVRLTRYPPALLSVFEKATAAGGVADNAASRHLWLIGPTGVVDSVQPPLAQRIDTLREL